MKINILKILVFTLLAISSCISQIPENKNLVITYRAQTRGSSLLLQFKNDAILYKTEIFEKVIVLDTKQVENIRKEVEKINLPTISSLDAPSSKRFSDGALAASFQINPSEEKYTSSEFDHENPPKELLKLYLLLVKYTN